MQLRQNLLYFRRAAAATATNMVAGTEDVVQPQEPSLAEESSPLTVESAEEGTATPASEVVVVRHMQPPPAQPLSPPPMPASTSPVCPAGAHGCTEGLALFSRMVAKYERGMEAYIKATEAYTLALNQN